MGFAYLSGADLFAIVQSFQTAGTFKPVIPLGCVYLQQPTGWKSVPDQYIQNIRTHTSTEHDGVYYSCIVCLFNNAIRPPLWSSRQFLATDPVVPGSIPGPTRISDK
jgi:hypothetical protein